MERLTVVAYNVRFGDAILVVVPDRGRSRTTTRHILIDMGNVLAGPGADRGVFAPVVRDIQTRLDGRPIDLYVMTHEHMDHVQGLPILAAQGISLPIDHAWLTASARPDYYREFPEARRRLGLLRAEYQRVRLACAQRGLMGVASVRAFLANNDPRSTAGCVAHLRRVARKRTSYVHRGFVPQERRDHPFKEARLRVWAPEQDSAAYYGRARPVLATEGRGRRRSKRHLEPPEGVSGAAFDALLAFAGSGLGDTMLAIDRAANNTSVVLELEWRGWRLLFPGDAELKSWSLMHAKRQLRPIHFLKVSHHASHNGTPPDELLEKILPIERPDDRPRTALVSTCTDTYSGVPDEATLGRIGRRVERIVSTRDVDPGKSVEIEFEA